MSDIPQITESKISECTVFLNGAKVLRKANISLQKGLNKLVLQNIPADINTDSLQVFSSANVLIALARHSVNYQDYIKPAALLTLEEEKSTLEDEAAAISDKMAVLESKEEILAANRLISGEEDSLKIADLQEALVFFTEALTEIKTEITALKKAQRKNEKKIIAIQSQIDHFSYTNPHSGEINLHLIAEEISENAEIFVSYFMQGANWSPSYEIKAMDGGDKIQIHCKANIYQNSGENWEDIKLTLSTGSPNISRNLPELFPWWLNVSSNSRTFPSMLKSTFIGDDDDDDFAYESEGLQDEVRSSPAAGFMASRSESFTSNEYIIPVLATIASGGEPQTIQYASYETPASFEYNCIAKLSPEVFLVAKIENWGELGLIPAEASIFFENSLVGKTYINPNLTDDTLVLSMGVDANIVVKRERGKKYSSKTIIGSSQKQSQLWNISAKNNKTKPISLTLFDQIPISENQSISVSQDDLSGASLDEKTGKLTWELNLAPAESKELTLGYTVSYPKNANINL